VRVRTHDRTSEKGGSERRRKDDSVKTHWFPR